MLLEGKIAFITGSSRGIGRATARLFTEHGAKVILNGRDEETLMELAADLNRLSKQPPLVLAYDVSNVDSVKQAFQKIKKEYGQLDILVNNAGVLSDRLLGMIQSRQINETMSINLNSTLYHMQYGSRLMMKQKSGSIINISSIMGVEGEAGQTVYAASKAAVIGATKSASKELAPYNIRVNAVAPGLIKTTMTEALTVDKYEERITSIKMQRIGQPLEVANGILFLASDMASYITGQVLGIDGGMII